MKIQKDHVYGVIIENEAFENEMGSTQKGEKKTKIQKEIFTTTPKENKKEKTKNRVGND